MSYGIVYTVDEDLLLLTHTNGQFIGFSDAEAAASHLAAIATKNSEINGVIASLFFVSKLDFGLIQYPDPMKDIAKYLIDYKPTDNQAKLYCHGIAGVKMHGIRVDKSISELKYEPKEEKPKSTRRKFNKETKETPKDFKPEAPKASSDSEDPYSTREWSYR